MRDRWHNLAQLYASYCHLDRLVPLKWHKYKYEYNLFSNVQNVQGRSQNYVKTRDEIDEF